MAVTINASTTAGLVNSADTSGILQLQTANTAAVTIDASQNVGVGTSSPLSKLDVKFATNKHAIFTASSSYSNSADLVAVNDAGSEVALGLGGSAVQFYTGATERMRLDASGNLGVGTTDPSGYSFDTGVDLVVGNSTNSAISVVSSTTGTGYLAFADGTSGADKYRGLLEYSHTDNFLGFRTNAVERARITSGGNLALGTTTSSSVISGTATVFEVANSNLAAIAINNTSGKKFSIASTTGSALIFYDETATAERARIDSSGNLLVGTTTATGANGVTITPKYQLWNASDTSLTMAYFQYSNTTVGSISRTTTATAYNTSSDYRLKNTIAPMTGALAKVSALKPCTYKWNADGSDGEGFIAHELAEVCPHAVTGEKDAVETYTDEDGNEQTRPQYQGIDVSFLVATLTAAIQEQQAIIESLKARLDAANL
jgi:hypothetical protein